MHRDGSSTQLFHNHHNHHTGVSLTENDKSCHFPCDLWRRRQRELRSWWRHERMTVAAEFAVALHHSRGVGSAVLYEAQPGQTPASSGGRRPGVLKEPEPPEVVEHASCPCSGAPLLAIPCLGGRRRGRHDHAVPPPEGLAPEEGGGGGGEEERGGEAAGGEVRGEDEAAQRQGQPRPAAHEWAAWRKWIVLVPPSSSSGQRRKRKKRKLPKTSSHLTLRRAHRRQQQRYVHGWFSCFGISHAVFPSVVGRSQLPGTVDDSSLRALVFNPGSGTCKAGFASFLALCFSTLSSGPRCSTSWSVRIRRTVYSVLVFLVTMLLALCSRLLSLCPRCSASWPTLDRCLEEYRKIVFTGR